MKNTRWNRLSLLFPNLIFQSGQVTSQEGTAFAKVLKWDHKNEDTIKEGINSKKGLQMELRSQIFQTFSQLRYQNWLPKKELEPGNSEELQ